ncbi:MAG: DUF4394 domain-containing protein [Dokdonella sp.]
MFNKSRARQALLAGALLLASPIVLAQTIVGLGDTNTLVRFSAIAPGGLASNIAITGLNAGDTLVGVDVRPATGMLYGIASSGRLYTINPASGVATSGATLDQPMTGTVFGVDFNPVADRLRVTSDTGQNLRINVDTGVTLVDGPLTAGPIIYEVGYTNSVSPTPATTALYDIDVVSSSLYNQNPPNNGTLVLVGALGVTIDAGSSVGMDIRGATNITYATLRVGGTTSLYTVNLANGAATLVGAVGTNPSLRGISVIEAAVLPALPATATAIGLRTDNTLTRFPVSSPSSPPIVTPVTGLNAGDSLIGIDFRPNGGALYGVARSGNLYIINPSTGMATFQATINVALTGNRFAVDFNPAADRLRVVSDGGQNLRINVADGTTTTDGPINPAGPQITSVGYTNSFAGTTTTALFDIDALSASLYLQNPPNAGTVQTVGALGVSPTGDSGLDILSFGGNNAAVASLLVFGTTGLYNVDLTSGAASLIGNVSGNPALVGLTLSPTAIAQPAVYIPVPVDSRLALLLLALGVIGLGLFARIRIRS